MRRVVVFILLVATLLLAGCGDNNILDFDDFLDETSEGYTETVKVDTEQNEDNRGDNNGEIELQSSIVGIEYWSSKYFYGNAGPSGIWEPDNGCSFYGSTLIRKDDTPCYVSGILENSTRITQIKYYITENYSDSVRGSYFEASVDGKEWVTLATLPDDTELYQGGNHISFSVDDDTYYNFVRIIEPTEAKARYWTVGRIEVLGIELDRIDVKMINQNPIKEKFVYASHDAADDKEIKVLGMQNNTDSRFDYEICLELENVNYSKIQIDIQAKGDSIKENCVVDMTSVLAYNGRYFCQYTLMDIPSNRHIQIVITPIAIPNDGSPEIYGESVEFYIYDMTIQQVK